MDQAVLTVHKLCKSFKRTPIIEDISFEVNKGEIMAILGPNGAGKSTTIRNIMGIMYPDEGEITFHQYGKAIPKHRIGYLPEERGLYKKVTVMDILLYFADLKDYPMNKARERATYYLNKFGLEGKEKVKVEELSKGMGQKVQFIASIIHEPDLLILDEPFSGLDPVSQDVFKQEISTLANSGMAILLSSHQMNMVEELCDRLLLIHKGQRVVSGTMGEIKQQYANYKCVIRGNNELTTLQYIDGVVRVEGSEQSATLYLEQDVHIPSWLPLLPRELDIQELVIDRISLHEIFVDIATDKKLMKVGDDDAQ
ncbi:ABC transporter ATP-binding protein [Pontibacillus salicampi]|uniref:ABC transporter ATP-binding protein n=1 Tax=Pontibacillus salicampi TaxID=1449801 RepID=A0ABV6LQA2_9BACI